MGDGRTALARGERTFVKWAGLGGLALVDGAWLAFPDWVPGFLTYIVPMRTSDPPRSVTLATPLAELLGPGGLWLALPIIALVLAIALQFRPSSDAWLPVWFAASVALTTYGWSYDHIVLIVPLVLAVGTARTRPRRALTIGLLGFGALLPSPPDLSGRGRARIAEPQRAGAVHDLRRDRRRALAAGARAPGRTGAVARDHLSPGQIQTRDRPF